MRTMQGGCQLMGFIASCIRAAEEYTESTKKLKKEKGGLFDYFKLRKAYNTVVLERDVLENTIKDELYKEFMKKLGEPVENDRLKKENKRLRQQVKSLKEIIKNND